MHLRTLGGLGLEGEGDAGLGRPKPLLLLAYLALEGPKERHHLAELFWPEATQPLNSLRVALTQLRAAAPDAVRHGPMVGGTPTLGTSLPCDAADLVIALDEGDGRRAAELYAGPFLDGFYLRQMGAELESWIYSTREHLSQRLQQLWLKEAEMLAGGGAFAEAGRVAADAYGVSGEREPEVLKRLHRLLLAGGHVRVADAAREAEEYGLLLDTDVSSARRALTSTARSEVQTNLPAPLTPLVGRDLEVVALGNLLSSGTRLITVVGLGGVGKSRLAVEVGAAALRDGQHGDGVYLIELDAVSDSTLVLDAVAATISAPPGGNARSRLDQALRDKRLLLILDNFEHVLGAAVHLTPLLRSHPGVAMLVTSREPLDLTGEQVFRLESLAWRTSGTTDPTESDAVRLFATFARRADLGFEVDGENLAYVLAICEAVHGMPLGIELAAASVGQTALADLAEELARTPDSLASSKRDASPRHGSLRATIEHSWRLLTSAEREAMASLSVFRGGFDRRAAARIAGASREVLASLTAKALLREVNGRYDFHPLVRGYAAERSLEDGRRHAGVVQAHADYYAGMACEAEEHLKGGGQAGWSARLEAELANLRLALSTLLGSRTGSPEAARLAMAATGAIWQFWLRRGRLAEGRQWYEAALAAAPEGKFPTERAKALTGAGVMAFQQGDIAASERFHVEALELRRQTGDRLGQARSSYNLASIAGVAGDLPAAERYLREAIAVFRELDDRWAVAFALNNLATLASKQGRPAEAVLHLQDRLRLQRELGDSAGMAETLCGLGLQGLMADDLEAAADAFVEAVELAAGLEDVAELVWALEGLALVRHREGRERVCVKLLGATTSLREKHEVSAGGVRDQLLGLADSLRESLGERFEAERRAGQSASLQDVVGLALSTQSVGAAAASE